MANYKRQRTSRRPSHPGEILKEVWLAALNLSQSELAQKLSDVTDGQIKKSTILTKLNEIINEKRAMSADFAVLLSKVLGTSPRMWLNLQVNLDIWEAEKEAA